MNDAAIIFDMDGLLADSEPLWQQVELDMIHSRGAEWDQEIIKRQIGMRLNEAAVVLVEGFGFDDEPQHFAEELQQRVTALFRSTLQPMPGAAALMEAALASNRPIGVASSSPREIVEVVLGKFGWLDQLDDVTTGDDPLVARGKPAPDIFLLAAERLQRAPADCVVLEDSLNGARGARAAGMTVIAVPNSAYTTGDFDGIAHRVVASLTELAVEELQPDGRGGTTNGRR